jgi:NitT/TauT family transport system ATP-binding protein
VQNSSNAQGARVAFDSIERGFAGTGVVIDGVSFSAEPGEFVALLGPSGCGKSTFLRLAAELDAPNAGRISINGFGNKNFRSFVFQDAHLLPWRSVLENVTLPLQLIGVSRDEALAQARTALAQVALSDSEQKFPNQLSGGMRMRVAVARAMVTRPTLLLMDEPFAALDENTRHRLQEELRKLWQLHRMTVLFVTHSVSEAVFLANRIVVLSRRPAHVTLDYKVALPEQRTRELRTANTFLEQMKPIYQAFERGEEGR